ncbi:YggS family pyridoxal phosphate-dependent enzyme [Perlabentimonas gracilis]|uniref:YggS family pyridoxal phosphate-dependent enzyme n=1 Tax=Perlabentimonas gracilis TaxID=2715279 RepID=UPI00140A1FC7|nr:YggS family pyridoxal phosphate-dependent enzyme [Perlabentimonas gracilis]NHB67292.1 YggS family pyridoxal phosphate-dependent enzyme [Perlabentimonas gracilis]
MSVAENFESIKSSIPAHVTLVAVSKTHPPEVIMEAYNAGQRIFGENKVQEMISKQEVMPKDIQWHLVGHLQTNKVKYIAPFVSLVHSVDSAKLLKELNKGGAKNNRIIDCLIQVHIAEEDTKFGLSAQELDTILSNPAVAEYTNVRIVGLMGMATFTDNMEQVRREFKGLADIYKNIKQKYFADQPSFNTLSMGMSGDFEVAIDEGSTMIRVGSSIFGTRNYGEN